MPSTTQSIVCCLGASVAGQPAQFLLERGFQSQQIDWRAITAAVEPDQLRIALDGLAAMRFQAIRLLPTLQSEALQLVANMPAECKFVGSATSAVRDSEGTWSWWHNRGRGTLTSLSQQPASLIWLDGDSELTRSLAVAIIEEDGNLSAEFSQVLWSEGPLGEQARNLEGHEEMLARLELGITPVTREQAWSLCTDQPVAICAETLGGLRHVIEQTPQAVSCDLIGGGAQELLRIESLEVQSSTDLGEVALAGEAWDFEAWTGSPVAIEVLREALEEFLGF